MSKKKLAILIYESIYNSFVAECGANDFKISEVLLAGITRSSNDIEDEEVLLGLEKALK